MKHLLANHVVMRSAGKFQIVRVAKHAIDHKVRGSNPFKRTIIEFVKAEWSINEPILLLSHVRSKLKA